MGMDELDGIELTVSGTVQTGPHESVILGQYQQVAWAGIRDRPQAPRARNHRICPAGTEYFRCGTHRAQRRICLPCRPWRIRSVPPGAAADRPGTVLALDTVGAALPRWPS